MVDNTTGNLNTASGQNALFSNTTGIGNTASGAAALSNNTTGDYNTASGWSALLSDTTGKYNTASGFDALLNNTVGANNIGVGNGAGSKLTTGSNNIDIGNAGALAESNTIRIGTERTQRATFIAGIYGTPVTTGFPETVVVNNSGQLGIMPSSARFKHDIRDMGGASSKLLKLRPVTFRYNNDPSNTLQYGLVAEEVAKSYPELASYGDDGKPRSVRYLELSAMLLNELQKQSRQLRHQADENQRQARQIQHLAEQSEQQAAQNRLLSAQVAQLKGMLEQVMATQRGSGSLAAAFNR